MPVELLDRPFLNLIDAGTQIRQLFTTALQSAAFVEPLLGRCNLVLDVVAFALLVFEFELENVLMAHDGVVEAAVIGVSHENWQERPLVCIVTADGSNVDEDELLAFLDDELDYPG